MCVKKLKPKRSSLTNSEVAVIMSRLQRVAHNIEREGQNELEFEYDDRDFLDFIADLHNTLQEAEDLFQLINA